MTSETRFNDQHRDELRSRMSRLIQEVCIPAGCQYPQTPNDEDGIYTCGAYGARKAGQRAIVMALTIHGCNKAVTNEGPGTLYPDRTFKRSTRLL